MADPQQDWFVSNAPVPVPARTAGDWFASNAPKGSGEKLPDAKWISDHYGHIDDTSPQQAADRYKNRNFMDKAIDFIQKPADAFTGHSEAAIDAAKAGQYARSGNEAFKAAAPIALAALPGQLVTRPLATVLGVGSGVVGGAVTGGIARAAGATPDQAELASNIGGILSGVAGANSPKALPFVAKAAGKAAGAITDAVDPDLLSLVSPRGAAALRWVTKAGKVAAKLSPAEETQAAAESEAHAVSGEPEPAPAPYRLSGNQIQDATTVTPRRVLGPDRQLAAAPEETPAVAPVQPPKTSQVLKDAGVTQAMKEAGIAAPSASMNPVRTTTGSLGITGKLEPRGDIHFPPGLSGEDAAMMQLTRYNISELRSGASKRGIPITPKDTHADLIQKIAASVKPEEVQGFQAAAQQAKAVPSQFPENNLIADGLNKEAAELQAGKGDPYRIATLRNAAATVRQYPQGMAQVDFAATKIRGIDKGIRQRIGDMLTEQKAVPGGDDTVQTTAGQPMTILEAMRASLIKRGVKPPY